MKVGIISWAILSILMATCGGHAELEPLNPLIGVWKVENKESYESWVKVSDQEYAGESYKMTEGSKRITETLSIKFIEGRTIYEARVFNQNDGLAIPFELNSSNKELISFENPTHDFPKKIQYQIVTNEKLLVNVLGQDDKGFSYFLLKQ
jgi:hypothetical protein